MLATPHMVAGTAIGKAVRRPWLVMPIAFLSHFVFDFVPHLDQWGVFGIPGAPPSRSLIVTVVLDTLIGIALVLWVTGRRPGRKVMLLGALSGAVIDLADNVPLWGPYFQTWPGTAWLSAFHHGYSHGLMWPHWPLGLSTQTVVIAIALWILRPSANPSKEPSPIYRK